MNSVKHIVHKHLLNEVRVKASDRIKLYEDTEWLVVQPLSFEASCKYGHGSSWCTSTPSNDTNYNQYNKEGILIYYLNKKNDNKYAEFIDFNGKQSFFDKQDDPINDLPDLLKIIQNKLKNDVFNLLKKKKEEVYSQYVNSPSIQWLNQLWSEMKILKSEKYPQSTFYGKSKNNLYFEQDEKNKYFRIDYFNIWSKIKMENQWGYQQTLNFFKYWLDEHLKLGYLTPLSNNGISM